MPTVPGSVLVFQSPSLRGSGRFSTISRLDDAVLICFNPLHCGAVVASIYNGLVGGKVLDLVSIPFIAGQWSLLERSLNTGSTIFKFQSPSLRGSGRFFPLPKIPDIISFLFQSPSLRGSGRFR